MIPTFIRSFRAVAAIAAFTITKYADPATGSAVSPATGPTDLLAGTSGKMGADAAGAMVDLIRGGSGSVQLGGAVQAGDALTSDAASKAVATTTAGHRIIGFADEPGQVDEIIEYTVAPGVIGEIV